MTHERLVEAWVSLFVTKWKRMAAWMEHHQVAQRLIVLLSIPLIWFISWTIFLPIGRIGYGLAMFMSGAVYASGAVYFIVAPNGADAWKALLWYFEPIGNLLRLKKMFDREPVDKKLYGDGGELPSYMTFRERVLYRWHYNLLPELTMVFSVFIFLLAWTAFARFLLPFGKVRYGLWMFIAGGLIAGLITYFHVSIQGQELLASFRKSSFVRWMKPRVRKFAKIDQRPLEPWEQ